jgi:hypothetical protein
MVIGVQRKMTIESDIGKAAYAFQQRHGSKGKLTAFVTENGGIERKVLSQKNERLC